MKDSSTAQNDNEKKNKSRSIGSQPPKGAWNVPPTVETEPKFR